GGPGGSGGGGDGGAAAPRAGAVDGQDGSVLHEVLGIRITRGGVAQALARLGERCGPTYGALVSSVRGSLLVVMDETGWRVGGIKAWLWVAVAELVTVYAIRRRRGFEEAAE